MEYGDKTKTSICHICFSTADFFSMYCLTPISNLLLHAYIYPFTIPPSAYHSSQFNSHPINLWFRQLSESGSVPVDEILAPKYQYVSPVHQFHYICTVGQSTCKDNLISFVERLVVKHRTVFPYIKKYRWICLIRQPSHVPPFLWILFCTSIFTVFLK